MNLNTELAGSDVDVVIGATSSDTSMVYVGTGCNGTIQLRAGHPMDETDILDIDQASFTAPGVYALVNVPKGTTLWVSYNGLAPCNLTIR